MSNDRILIVDSELSIAKALAATLEKGGFHVKISLSVNEGEVMAVQFRPAVVIVSLDLLTVDRFAFCGNLRHNKITSDVRILMLSNGSDDEGELVGLALGADDYIVKPFELKHLMHRIGVLLKRRSTHEQSHHPIRRDGLELDFDRRTALLYGFELELTATEFRILWVMAQKPGCVFERSELLKQARGKDANCSDRTVDVHIRSIRRKLGTSCDLIETVRCIGYRFRETKIHASFGNGNDRDFAMDDEFTNPTALAKRLTVTSDDSVLRPALAGASARSD